MRRRLIKSKKRVARSPSEKPIKKKIKKPASVDGGNSTYFKIAKKIFNSVSGIEIDVYLNVDKDHVVDQLTPKGTRVLVAKYPDFHKIYLYKIHETGDPHFPKGGVTVYNSVYEMKQYFCRDSVAIHPDGGSYKFRSDENVE